MRTFNHKSLRNMNRRAGFLRPEELPEQPVFRAWQGESNRSIELGGRSQAVAEGEIRWERPLNATARFVVLPAVVRPHEVAAILALVNGTRLHFDADPDTVDGMATHEIFVEDRSGGGLGTSGGLKGDSDPAELEARRPLRERLLAIMRPILDERLTPFVRRRFAAQCGRGGGRACTPCYSLVRRYRSDERVSHGVHHDGHALVTAVVSLSDHGREYTGGLYVATSRARAQTLALQRGDAVVHQSDLLHGVRVGGGERWSWILWFRDSETCEEHSHEWFPRCAAAGDPICQNLHAGKVGNVPGMGQAEAMEQTLRWTFEAARNGHGASMFKLGRAYLHKLPSTLPLAPAEAVGWLRRAVEAQGEPDAYYCLAQRVLEESDGGAKQLTATTAADVAAVLVALDGGTGDEGGEGSGGGGGGGGGGAQAWLATAVRLFEAAAEGRHSLAMYNLGVAHLYGHGVARRNADVAAAWFEASGLPEGMYAVALHRRAAAIAAAGAGTTPRVAHALAADAARWEARARRLGFGQPWRKPARVRVGSGGVGGVDLHSAWPDAGSATGPPDW